MKSKILTILKDIRFGCDYTNSKNFVEDGFIDSFDIMILVEKLENNFLIKIPGDQITMQNFCNLKNLEMFIEKLTSDQLSFHSS